MYNLRSIGKQMLEAEQNKKSRASKQLQTPQQHDPEEGSQVRSPAALRR